MISVLKRANSVARHLLLAGAVALLVAGTSGVGRAGEDDPQVPEISLNAVGGAMALLAGGLLLARERLRTRPAAE